MKEIIPKYDEVSDINTLLSKRGFYIFDALTVKPDELIHSRLK